MKKRILFYSLAVGLVMILASGIFVRWYLRSHRMVQRVTTQLQTIYGGHVQVGDVDVGLNSTSLKDLAFYEHDSTGKKEEPWLKIGSLTLDVSLWELVRDEMPKQAIIDNPVLAFRFDRAGELLTRFPAAANLPTDPEALQAKLASLPSGEIKNGEFIFRKEGEQDLVVKNLDVRLVNELGKLVVTGTGDSAELGKLILNGTLDKGSTLAIAQAKTASKAHVTQAILNRVPFIPGSFWEEVQIQESDSTGALQVTFDLNTKAIHYRLDLVPEKSRVLIPALELSAHDAGGKVTVEDELVTLRDMVGFAYGGKLFTEGTLDFRGPASKLQFPEIKVENLNLAELPESWNIPNIVRNAISKGKLFGTASLEINIVPASLISTYASTVTAMMAGPTGLESGQWLFAAAVLPTFPGQEFSAQSKGKGEVRDPTGKTDPIDFDWQLGPRRSRSNAGAQKTGAMRTPMKNESSIRLAMAKSPSPLTPYSGGEGLGVRGKSIPSETALPNPEILSQQVLQDGPAEKAPPFAFARDFLARQMTLLLVGGNEAKPAPDAKAPAKEPKGPPNYLDLDLHLKNVNLGELIKNMNLNLPYDVEGKITFKVKASLPIDRPDDLKAYKLKGSAEIAQFLLAGVRIEKVDADFDYADGMLTLKSLKGQLSPTAAENKDGSGMLQGSGQVQMVPLGELKADLKLDRVPVNRISFLQAANLQGTVSGNLHVQGNASKLQGLASLEADGNVTSDQLKAYGLSLDQFAGTMELKNGLLKIPSLQGKVEGVPLTASAEMRLDGNYPFQVKTDLRKLDLATLKKLTVPGTTLPSLAGTFSTNVAVDGTLNPFKANASGDVQSEDLKIEKFEVQNVRFHWLADTTKVELKDLDANLYGGQTSGTAMLPLDSKSFGKVDLSVRDLNVKQFAKDLRIPFRIEGKVNGTLKGTFPSPKDGKISAANLDVDIKAPKMRVQNIPTEQLHGNVEYQKGIVSYKLEGKSLGGSFDLEGQIPGKDQGGAPKKEESKKGRLNIKGIHLGRLVSALNIRGAESLGGTLSLQVNFTQDSLDHFPQGKGVLRFDDLRWKDTSLADSLQGDVFLDNGQVRLRNLSGNVGQGSFDARLTYDLRHPERGSFAINLENVDAAIFAGPMLDDKISGAMSARVRGRLGETWNGTADVDCPALKVRGFTVTQVHLPITWSFSPGQDRGQIDVYETTARIGQGRATGKVSMSWDYSARVEGYVRLDNADLQDLLRQTVGSSQIGGGRTTGRFDFGGTNVRSLNDLNGNLAVTFKQTQALQVPVLSSLAPLLGAGPSTTFQNGNLRGRLNGGVFRIQQMALSGTNVQVFIDGDVTVAGRLNLFVIGRTGNIGLPSLRLGPLTVRIPPVGPIPLIVLVEASNLLSNQAINLQITGTVSNPVIRPRPVALISQEAVRFFFLQSASPVVPTP